MRSSSTPRDAKFLFHGTPYFGGSSTGCGTVGSTAENVACSVHVGVRCVSARSALVALAVAALLVDHAALGARLRGVGGGHLDDERARLDAFVSEHGGEARPTCAAYTPSETAANADHVLDAQRFENDDALALGVPLRLAVQDVVALATDFTVDAVQTRDRSRSILRSFLSTGDGSLRATEAFLGVAQVARVLDDAPIRVGQQVDTAAINSDGGLRRRHRFGDLDLANDRTKPLITVAFDSAGLRFADKWAVDDHAHWAYLREVQCLTVEAPYLRVRLGQSDYVTTAALPARGVGETPPTPLPCGVEVDEQLSRDVARYIGEPWQIGTQTSQLVRLIERRRIASIIARVSVSDDALLVREVPQEPQGITPAIEPRRLLGRRVEAVAKCFAEKHWSYNTTTRR